MFLTTEVRWFGEGDIPRLIRTWFDLCQGEITGYQIRTDLYLADPGSELLGIKLREGRLEIKQLTSHYGLVQLHRHVNGLVEQWRKWGFELGPNQFDPDVANLHYPFGIRVQKERQLHSYQLAPNGLLSSVAQLTGTEDKIATEDIRRCDVELSSIWVDNRRWWSLALEASGPANSTYEDLLGVFRRLAEMNEPPLLTANTSFSYPSWLTRL